MSYKSAIAVLEELAGYGDKRNPKLEAMTRNKDNKTLQRMFWRTYDWEQTYGLRVRFHTAGAVSAGQRTKPLFGEAARDTKPVWESFEDLLDKLAARKLSGNAAKQAWDLLCTRLSEQEKQWFSRILNRDLKIKVDRSTIEKVWPDLIRPFGCQLANSVGDVGDFVPTKKEPWLTWPVAVEPKFDGMRVLIEYRHDVRTCTGFSREGHMLTHIQDLLDPLAVYLSEKVGKSCWVDTEALAPTSEKTTAKERFNQTLSLVKAEDVTPELRQTLQFHVFDLAYQIKLDERPQSERRTLIKELFGKNGSPPKNFVLVRRKVAQNMEELMGYFDAFLNEGHEGVMVKFDQAPYRAKRTNAWLKLKPTKTVEAGIIGFETGKQGSKNEHRLGALVAKRLDTGETIRIGMGFKDHERDSFWADQEAMIGKIVEFKEESRAGAETTANFPRFLRMRDDRESI